MSLELIITLILVVFPAINYFTFPKAGFKSYLSLIPFYNYYIWLKLIGKPWWWLLLMLVPFINVFMVMLFLVQTAVAFGKYKLWEQALAVVFPIVYIPYLGISKKEKYYPVNDRIKPKRSQAREWIDALIFAIVAATIIRMFIFEAYTIPTSSMEKSLLVGDFLVVSKVAYGPKIPNTPLAFPLVHHTLPLSKTAKSYVEWIKLPYYRFPGYTDIKRGDAVVFNFPEGDTVALFVQNQSYYALTRRYGKQRVDNDRFTFGKVISRPVDKRDNYIKRCIALPGDSLKIVNQEIYINGQKTQTPANAEFIYKVKTDGTPINKRILTKLDITEEIHPDMQGNLLITLTDKGAEELKKVATVKSVEKSIDLEMFDPSSLFPFDTTFHWTIDNYGTIWIPKKGATVNLTLQNLPLYERIIHAYELNDLKVENGKIYINGAETDKYTFKYNYYWMMGDNRHNSLDSRFWGFVPENHVVGKAVFVWLSLDKNKPLFGGKVRWNKIMRKVK